MTFLRQVTAFIKQLVVTLVVLAIAGAGYLFIDPSAGRSVLNAGFDVPGPVRQAILTIAPEAGQPAPQAPAGGAGKGGRRAHGGAIVVADTVTTGLTRTRMKAIGSGEAARSVTVYPDNTTGIMDEVDVGSGDTVKAGQILARLEHANEEVAVDRARIALDAAQAKVDRYQKLQQSRTMSAVEVNDVIRERDNAKLDVRAAEIALAKRDIRAPIAGRVGIVNVDKGDLVNNQTAIATVDDRGQLKVIFYTPETYVKDLKIGEPIEAVSTARPDKIYKGRISAIDSRLDQASRTLRTEAMVDNAKDELRPGMSFTVNLSLPGETFLAVDPLAVVWERDGPIVWKIVDGKSQRAPVRIVERTIDRVLVASNDLQEGDRIVVEGLQAVRDGGPVQVQNDTPAKPAAKPAGDTPGALPSAEARTPAESGENRHRSASEDLGIRRAAAAELAAAQTPQGVPTPSSPDRAASAR